ncbi:hypothetical protein SAMN05421858_0769 [Haladaptatus litoreus]|uniref:Uncharacterized protein n=1 Tax=Haladaptatus litoreus TaxID=553468 RepID=A0A1N6WL39_9EURY|nr:hypothetical protein SAMN05421858_0769 [Haladaptatus litoreus]
MIFHVRIAGNRVEGCSPQNLDSDYIIAKFV